MLRNYCMIQQSLLGHRNEYVRSASSALEAPSWRKLVTSRLHTTGCHCLTVYRVFSANKDTQVESRVPIVHSLE